MNCPSCGHENDQAAKFCSQCAAPLLHALTCHRCGASNGLGSKFCNQCAQPLDDSVAENADGGFRSDPSRSDPGRHPTSFCDGRYRVVRFLGEGGKKRVFLAHDTKLDRDVAFALIKTDGLDAEGQARIRREAQAMGKLGDHQHIVPVHDIGEEGGQPYLVTQLMGGGDVEGLIERAEGHRLPLEQALSIANQICQALEHAHSHGIIHRDLKPGNVWLTADPSAGSGQATAKLGDFGLAVALDRSRLTQAGMMVGTAHYMPPEQAIGGEVTPRSDLYSLGAMLYEMACGRPPFLGDESVAIITQHLNTPPLNPSWHVPELPPGLEALILRLLEKDPSKRPASAAEVRQALTAVASSEVRVPSGTDSELATRNMELRADPLYGRTFVGREQELRQLQSAFDASLSGQGSLAMVVGEPGIGKTSLCEQLATYVAVRGGRALVGHCYEEGSLSLPYLPFVEAMRSYVLSREPDDLRKDLGSGAAEVARLISEIRDRLQVELRPAGDPEDDRWRLLQAVSGFLRNASTVQPLLLVLEDLHDADRGTIDLLLHVARNLQGARLLIVGTYRDVEVDRSHPLSGALAELRRAGSLLRVPLRGLTVDEVHRMMNVIRGQEVPWSRAEAVHRQTEGNPLFIQEVLRYLVEEGLVVREGGRYVRTDGPDPSAGIPEGLRDVIGKRLGHLSDRTNQVLSIAAVVGRDFRLDVLQRVAGLPDAELETTLEEASARALIEQRPSVGSLAFRFTHGFFRQTLYEEIFASRRLRLHQQVAQALEHVYARRLEDHAAELAEHFAQSTDPSDLKKALHYSELAAQRAMGVYAYGEAVRHLRQALKVLEVQEALDAEDLGKHCDLLLALGQALAPAGESQRVFETVAEEAFTAAHRLNDSSRAARAAELAVEAGRRYGGGRTMGTPLYVQWVERLAAESPPGTGPRVRAEAALAEIHLQSGRWIEGWLMARGAFEAARQMNDPETLFRAALPLIALHTPPKDWEEDLDLLRELAALDHTGLSVHTLSDFLWSGWSTSMAGGERNRADELWRELEQLSARSRDPGLALLGLFAETTRLILDGDLEAAVASSERLVTRGDELGSRDAARLLASFFALRALLYLGRAEEALAYVGSRGRGFRIGERALCLAYAGKLSEARSELSETLNVAEISDQTASHALGTLLEAAVLVGDSDASRLLAELLGDVPGKHHPPVSLARIGSGASLLLGDRAAARARLDRALEWATTIRHRPEVALARLQLAELLLGGSPGEQAGALGHLDFAIEEFRAMKMQPSLERALTHKGLLNA